ncbi:hypothetical protein Bca52824_088890 [Brassica carinata]|uniref:Lsm14-like N-terminal domain-containing protein n=1 Tax=Brassica carinata TaxID=52824 RepID=A0A8X7PE39_BRACI|nr:hypothetical protein Bca52824_088890 [Brassica carinata]
MHWLCHHHHQLCLLFHTSYQNLKSYIGSFINLVSNYKSFLRHLNPHGLALGLQNVICYGTENNNDNGFQVPPYVVLKKTQIKKLIVTLPSSFTHYGYGCLAREATLSKRSPHATTQPLPEVLNIALPQYSGSAPPTYAASSELVFVPQSFFATFGPIPISYPPIDEGLDLEELTNNFKQYELWGGPQENNNLDDVNTIDGSSYVISRSPFDPIGRPCNPFGPIERPLPHLPSSCELAADLGFV